MSRQSTPPVPGMQGPFVSARTQPSISIDVVVSGSKGVQTLGGPSQKHLNIMNIVNSSPSRQRAEPITVLTDKLAAQGSPMKHTPTKPGVHLAEQAQQQEWQYCMDPKTHKPFWVNHKLKSITFTPPPGYEQLVASQEQENPSRTPAQSWAKTGSDDKSAKVFSRNASFEKLDSQGSSDTLDPSSGPASLLIPTGTPTKQPPVPLIPTGTPTKQTSVPSAVQNQNQLSKQYILPTVKVRAATGGVM